MKKTIGFLFLAFAFAVIPTAHAQVSGGGGSGSFVCPTGWICTPAPITASSTSFSGGGGGGGSESCFTWTRNLSIGSRGADVVALQVWLIKNGFDISLISRGVAARGYYGPSTALAVRKMQTAEGLPITGNADVLTRAFLNANSCGLPVGTNTSATISLDGSSPLTSTVAVTNRTQGQYLGLPVLVFDIHAQGSDATINNIAVNVNSPIGGSGGTLSAAYLYRGSTLIASAAIVNGVASFNIPAGTLGATIPANTTAPYLVKVDVTNVTSGSGFTVSANVQMPGGVSLTTPSGNKDPVTGSAVGNTLTVVNQSVVFSLAGEPTITTQNVTPGGSGTSTIKVTATYNVLATAIGQNVALGLPNSANPAFSGSNFNQVGIYTNGVLSTLSAYPNIIASYSQPANTTLSSDGTSFIISPNQTVTIPVTYNFIVYNTGGNICAVQMRGIAWSAVGSSNTNIDSSMANSNSWQTSATDCGSPYAVPANGTSTSTSAGNYVNLSLDASSPLVSSVQVTDTTDGAYLGLPVLVFDLQSPGGLAATTLQSLSVNIDEGNGSGSVNAAYLYQGSQLLSSASVVNGVATFNNINYTLLPNVNKPYTVKIDVSNVGTEGMSLSASVAGVNVVSSQFPGGQTLGVAGVANGNLITVTNGNVTSTGNDEYTHDYTVNFSKNFNLTDVSSPVTMTIAADNSYAVTVNGINVGSLYTDDALTSTHQIDITRAVRLGNNQLNISVTNLGVSGSTWATNPGGLSYSITQNGNLVTASDGSDTVSSNLGKGYATILSYWHIFWQAIPGAQWIWDSDQGVSNHPYPLTPAHPITFTSTSTCPSGFICTPTITVTNPSVQNNQPPVISGGTFPTTLNVGQSGTWTVNASDPQNGSLSYSVNWGDYSAQPRLAQPAVTQTSTFTHSYASAGNYYVTFTVTNSAGLSAQTNATVQVIVPTITVCPAGYTCTSVGTTLTCPTGYICTPVAITGCPTGYTCSTQTVAPSIVSTPQPVVSSITTSGTTISIHGSGFGSDSKVTVALSSGIMPTTYTPSNITSTGMTLSLHLAPNTYTAKVISGGQTSNSVNFTITSSQSSANYSFVPAPSGTSMAASIWDAIRQYFNQQ